MKIKKLVSVFMMGVMVASNTPVNAFADDVRSASEVMGEDVTTSGSPIAVSDNSVSIDFNVTGKWNNGFNGEITVNNLTEKVIENWQIELSFPQEITNIWNAQIVSYEDGVYNIKNAGGNNNLNISAGGSVTFGFSGTYTDEIIAPTNVKLITDKQNAAEEEYSIEYQLMSDWGSGFNAQIVITNNSDKPIEAWSLEFEFDREIENIWNAVVEEHNNHKYYITNAEYNSAIPSGGSVGFGFNGKGGNKDCEPQNYVLKRTENISSGLPDTEFVNVKTTNSDYYLTEIGYAKGDYANSVTQNLTLPTVGEYNGSTIVWSSSNENIVSSEGVVTRPAGESQYVTLTATFTDEDGSTIQKDYTVKVIKKFVEKELIVCDFNNLAAINDGEMPFIWIEENTGRIKFMRGKYTDYKVESPQEAIYSLNALKKLYGFKNPEEEYVFLMDYDLENVMRIRLQQVYKGITVRGSHLVITTDKEGNIMSITGTYDDIGDLSVTPVSTAKDLSKAIGTDLSEKSGKFFVYDKDGEYVLCWEIYNKADGNTYLIQDGTLEVLSKYKNEAYANSLIEKREPIEPEVDEKFNDLNNSQILDIDNSQILDIETYVSLDKDEYEKYKADGDEIKYVDRKVHLYAMHHRLFPISKYSVVTNYSIAKYGQSIIGCELYDCENNIRCLYNDNNDKKNKVIEYKDESKNNKDKENDEDKEKDDYRHMGVQAMYYSNKALNFFKSLGLNNIYEISGSLMIDEEKSKNLPLTIIVSKGGESSNTGGIGTYSYDKRSLTLGTEGEYKACEQYDVIIHEMTHGYLYNTVKLTSNDNDDIKAIHEGYGDILACLANDNWHFQESYHGEGNGSRNLANPGPGFQVKYDSKNKGAGCHYRATILGHAAYKMNHPDSKNKGAAIDKDLLAKIWFDSMGKLPGKNTGFSDVAASVINSAYERGCTSAQIDTIRTAFRDANIPVPNRMVFGRVYDGLNNPISKFNLLIDRKYTVKTVDNIYCACTYDDNVGEYINITCKSDGYTDFNYLV